jgi:hypothetical protein
METRALFRKSEQNIAPEIPGCRENDITMYLEYQDSPMYSVANITMNTGT